MKYPITERTVQLFKLAVEDGYVDLGNELAASEP